MLTMAVSQALLTVTLGVHVTGRTESPRWLKAGFHS